MSTDWEIYLGILRGEYIEMGSKGSGNWGHKGRPGKKGGSAPSKGGASDVKATKEGQLTKEQIITRSKKLIGQTVEVSPKHTGWTRKVTFSKWENYGKERLYASYTDYDRKRTRRNHGGFKGFVDLQNGDITGPFSFRKMIKQQLQQGEKT